MGLRTATTCLLLAILAMVAIASVAIPDSSPESESLPPVDLVKVDKSDRTLSLVGNGAVVATFRIALGGNPVGHKQQEGDQRTPEGRYTIDFRKEDSAFFRALHVSYPNDADKSSAQQRGVAPGGAIMIHGQKNGLGWLAVATQRFDWTDGCIALSNADMQRVWEAVRVPTPIEISP